MKKTIWVILLLILCFCSPVSADFYKYKDRDGTVRYTDDLSNVPEDQRPDVTSYDEAEPTPEPDAKDTPDPKKHNRQLKKGPKSHISIDAQGKQIKRRKDELDKQYNELLKEKNQIEMERKNAKTIRQTKEINRKITVLNENIYQWEQKRKAINAELDEYNARVAEEIKKNKK